ncbi:unnamed protein product [Rotaria magnacalcarata]|uniref:Uncharacterized protein n=1 Tax=Rotaria magnacalcarata TaxID=392030 RepID=A0A8S2N294_9BILA|nr:unnamed protein product [Rotaria magnacalcarata]
MTSKHHNQSSRRHPLKRVRLDNENQGFLTSLNGRVNKTFCRQSSEDSAFVENEKSSDERAFDLFHKEYFSQFRPYFKHYSIAVQFIEHLWLNMIESSKLSFVKKKLKEQGIDDLFTKSYNDTDTFSNDENDSQISRSLNDTNQNIVTLNGNHKYSRGFVNDLLYFCKHWITPRFIDKNDDQYSNASNLPLLTNNDSQIKVNHVNDSSSQIPLSEIIESITNVTPSLSPITSMVSANSNNLVLPPTLSNSSLSISFDSERNDNENIPFVMSDSLTTSELPMRRTYVILTELDEPFFGPYPIEFTITI